MAIGRDAGEQLKAEAKKDGTVFGEGGHWLPPVFLLLLAVAFPSDLRPALAHAAAYIPLLALPVC